MNDKLSQSIATYLGCTPVANYNAEVAHVVHKETALSSSIYWVILFDFGGTLDGDGERWAERFHRAYQASGGTLPLSPFEEHFRRSDTVLATLPDVSRMGLRRMIDTQAALLVDFVEDGTQLDPRRIAERFHQTTLRTIDRNRPLLERLARQHRLGIVSNFTGNLEHCLVELGLAPLFEVTCDSAVVGSRKPDLQIFRTALAALGAKPANSWMIGDNFEADIRPAAALGMRTCWLAPVERPLPADGVATAHVARLPDALALLT